MASRRLLRIRLHHHYRDAKGMGVRHGVATWRRPIARRRFLSHQRPFPISGSTRSPIERRCSAWPAFIAIFDASILVGDQAQISNRRRPAALPSPTSVGWAAASPTLGGRGGRAVVRAALRQRPLPAVCTLPGCLRDHQRRKRLPLDGRPFCLRGALALGLGAHEQSRLVSES